MRDLKSQLLTGRMAETAREYLQGTRTPAEPRPASTVILLRNPLPHAPNVVGAADGVRAAGSAGGPEVYLLRRQRTMAFAAGMTVFPGGRVDATDSTVADSWSGPTPAWFGERFGCSADTAAAYVAAAVRETFEESGVLLAGPSADAVVEDTTGDDWEADRVALESRELGFSEFLHRRGLVLRADLLGPWTHWITPEFEPKRYDTAFFVAALPAGQVTRDVTSESDQVTWIRPADAVGAVDAGDVLMLPPTYVSCRELSQYADVAAILDAAGDREIRAIMPTVRLDGDQAYLETT
ncbi:NUDIX hydrolase [Kribbella sp. NPDC048928]|uniref:NUDIX hydrolase n=1 Tax=Kribbella sp. NPDC048928 TaxID=3364111 RepID=UPI00371F0AE6